MASTLHSTPNQDNSYKSKVVKRHVITSTWFIIALLISALTLAVWVFSAAPAFEEKTEIVNEPSIEESILNIGQISHIDDIKQLEDAVQPISFDVLVKDLRDYPPEFKDFKYLEENQGKWTVQVMDVSEHEVITDYLSSRKDRNKFAYFRYRDNDNQARYLLTYGAMASPQMAMGAAKTIDFKLPANVRVLPEEIDRYLDLIENYELATGTVKDLSNSVTKDVKLQPTSTQLPAKQESEKATQQTDGDEEATNNNVSETSSNASTQPVVSNAKPMETEYEIKGSTDTSETLSVVEGRKLVDSSQIDVPKAQPNPPKKPEPLTTPSPVVPPVIKQPAVPVKPTNNESSQTNGNGKDAIKALIESKNE